MPQATVVGASNWLSGQKNGTLLINPISKGGFPTGVSEPPILATIKVKNTIVCTLYVRQWFALISGRIKSTAAPVVPNQLDMIAPIKRIIVFIRGFPTSSLLEFYPSGNCK